MEQIREDNKTRLRRAGAWIKKANLAEKDPASKFIFYWIAFNAQYSSSKYPNSSNKEAGERDRFLDQILKRDQGKGKLEVIFNSNKPAIKKIFELPHTHRDFWKEPKGQQIKNIKQWLQYFKDEGSLPEDKEQKLKDFFSRLSVVRNQIFHGSHSGNERSFGITQVRTGAILLSKFIPCFYDIIQSSVKENPDTKSWGEVSYHRQGNPDEVDCPPSWLANKK